MDTILEFSALVKETEQSARIFSLFCKGIENWTEEDNTLFVSTSESAIRRALDSWKAWIEERREEIDEDLKTAYYAERNLV